MPAKPLMRVPDFQKLFLSASTAQLGAQVTLLALPLVAILGLHASAVQVGLLAALGTLPYLLVGLPAGAWLERARLKRVLSFSALGRAVVLGSVPLLWAFHEVDMGFLYAIAVVVGLMSTFYDIAWQSYLPSLVGTSRLHEASSRLSIASSGAQLFGPGLAGFLIRALSAPLALLADAIGFVVAATSVQTIEAQDPPPAERADDAGVARRVVEGLSYVTHHELLRWIAVGTGAWNFVGTALNVVLVLFEARVLHYSAGTIGLVFLLGNVGYVIGAPLVRKVTARLGVGRTMLLGATLGGLGPLLLPMARPEDAMGLLVGGWFFRALGSPLYTVNQISVRLAITPAELTARMTATMKFFVMGAMPLGSFLGGALAGALGYRPTLWVIAAVAVAPVLATALSKLRLLSDPPEKLRPGAVALRQA
ncbi:MAG: MFS transporter [Actinomycetota bacterium]|nr:MFS transporter [Actinomycetota bacterium]